MTRLAVTQALQRLAAFAREADLPIAREAVIVGGALRDVLLSRSPREIDIALPGDARAFARAAAEQLGSRAIPIDDRLGVDRLPFADGSIDIVRRSADLAADLARRDFTINALAFPLVDLPASGLPAVPRERLIDQHGGLADLDARLLRTTGPTVLREDPLRALRAARFVAELGFRIDPATAAGVAEVASLVRSVAPERVGAELQRLFAADRAFSGVALMEEVGLLSVCFPELDAGRGLEQRPHHRYDVFRHQLASLQWLDVLLSPQPPADETEAGFWAALWRGADWDDLRDHLGWQAVPLRLAVLLHDVGKPATYRAEPDGRTRFFGHAELGAAMTRDALQRWRIPQAIVQRVALLIEQHLRPGPDCRARQSSHRPRPAPLPQGARRGRACPLLALPRRLDRHGRPGPPGGPLARLRRSRPPHHPLAPAGERPPPPPSGGRPCRDGAHQHRRGAPRGSYP